MSFNKASQPVVCFSIRTPNKGVVAQYGTEISFFGGGLVLFIYRNTCNGVNVGIQQGLDVFQYGRLKMEGVSLNKTIQQGGVRRMW